MRIILTINMTKLTLKRPAEAISRNLLSIKNPSKTKAIDQSKNCLEY